MNALKTQKFAKNKFADLVVLKVQECDNIVAVQHLDQGAHTSVCNLYYHITELCRGERRW